MNRHFPNAARRHARTMDEAFRTPRYADPFEHHLGAGLWCRLVRAWRRLIC